MSQEKKKKLVWLIVVMSFLTVFVFNLFTPLLSDDLEYAKQARSASNLLDLFKQEYHQYMTWNGRSVTFMLFRIFLCAPEFVLKFANSIVFSILGFLIYMNIQKKDKWNPFTMLLVQLSLWIFAVSFAQTILWECGAFVYLWGMTIILGFMTCLWKLIQKDNKWNLLIAILMFFFGWAGGWCNENTSGGSLLFVLILIVIGLKEKKKNPLYLYTAFAGNLIGLGFLVLGPGVRGRAKFTAEEENFHGIVGIIARIQKLTLYNRQAFLCLYIILMATIIWTYVTYTSKNGKTDIKTFLYVIRLRVLFFALHLATDYALAATATPQIRALFGSGIFLIIAVIQGITDNLELDAANAGKSADMILRFSYSLATGILLTLLTFEIVNSGAMLGRLRRDYNERMAYIQEQIDLGNENIVVAKFHEEFNNRYTCAFDAMELEDDPSFWTNIQYEKYFGVKSIRAIPYEEWEANYR